MEAIKVAVIDDHKLFRDGIAELIRGFSGYEVVIEADNGRDFIQQLTGANLPDIVLLDINMKIMDGFETAQWIRQQHPGIKLLILSMYENENAVIRMLRYGARGYVLKDIRKRELEQALNSLVTKGYYYTEMITGKLIHALSGTEDHKAKNTQKEVSTLSTREIEFLKLVCSELSYKEIAQSMCLSIHTIDGYRDVLFTKLNIKSRVGLVLFAIRNKIVFIE
ncbi:response regulator transcription factor [Puia sp.]|jgi:DNA-binding NarL/FixJ family response regulator|uniref:response regulator transcription factor n=1 Tax=Puia sp. TaxID=2045100 RepID=UPI002F40B681